MARSAVKRYLLAAFAFMAAAIWFGEGLTNGFACLLVFELALQAARLYQRRSSVHGRRAPAEPAGSDIRASAAPTSGFAAFATEQPYAASERRVSATPRGRSRASRLPG